MTVYVSETTEATITGIVNTIIDFCVANGWTYDGTLPYVVGIEDWLHIDDVYVRLSSAADLAIYDGFLIPYYELKIESKTADGKSLHNSCYIRTNDLYSGDLPLRVMYADNPHTVWITVQFGTASDIFSHAGFGYMNKIGTWKGGTWLHGNQVKDPLNIGNLSTNNSASYSFNLDGNPVVPAKPTYEISDTSCFNCMPFWENTSETGNGAFYDYLMNSYIHCEIRGRIWENDPDEFSWPLDYSQMNLLCPTILSPLYAISIASTTELADQNSLLPFYVGINGLNGLPMVLGNIEHIRFVNIRDYSDGQVLTIGSDKWKVYPISRKDAAYPMGKFSTGSGDGGSTGYLGIAIRDLP
jgi:hypothetical protein